MEERNKKIWEEALQYAFAELDKKGWTAKNNGRYYFVVNEGQEYPNKKVLYYVEKYFDKKKVELIIPSSANNGERLNAFLANNGAEVISKKESFISSCIREQSDVIKKLLEDYKKQIKSGALKYEEYKWLLFASQKGMPSLQKSTIVDELLSMKFANLLYYSAISTMRHLNKDRKDQYSDLLVGLYDENIDIEERIKQFSGGIESLYREVETKLQHHHDERTISTLLSFKYPEKYLLFKNSFYQKLCNLLEMESLDKGEKYLDYLEIAEEIRDNFIKTDTELLSLVKQYLPEGSYDDPNYNLLTQDFLYTMLEKSNDYYDQFKQVKKLFNDKLKNLDNSSIKYKERNGKDFQWVQDKYGIIGNDYIHYELYCNKSSIYIDLHLEDEAQSKEITLLLKELYVHILNKKYDSELVSWIDWANKANSKDYFQSIRFYKAFSLDEDDILEEQSISEMIESFIELDKIIGDDIREFLINNNQVENQLAEKYKAEKEMNTPLNQILYGPPGTGKTYHTINKALAIVAPNFDLNQEREVVKQEFDKYVENGQIVFTTFHQSMTYEDFVEGIKPKVDEEQEEKSVYYEIEKGVFTKLVEHAKAHQIDKTEKKKIYTFEDGWNDLINEATEAINNGSELVLPIQTPTMGLEVVDITDRGNLRLKPKSSDKALTYTVSMTRTQKLYNVFNNLNTVKNIDKEFRAVIGGSNSTAYWAVLNYIINKVNGSVDTISEKQERKPYVLIIDEINRGNVSAIFGELITLIEVSKRLGKEEALQVILPYSKEKFGVPDNLYIIGTMNTADRSIEALDTALRRRFTFEEMIPKTEKVRSEIQLYNDLWKWKDVTWESKEWQIVEQGFSNLYGYTAEWDVKKRDLWKEFVSKGYNESDAKDLIPLIENKLDLELILETINARIEVLLDRDHLIGHSYFLGVDSIATLMSRFKNNIIPLLQEYFYGDYGKIGLVLGGGFVTKVEGMKVSFASFDYDSEMYQDKITYTLKPIEDEGEFRKAIDALLIKK
ncbi:hypothetical protein AS361_14875 [Myroides marinus]|uniref:McrB family protein n=1 Tax=Myroides marinus TaxID=703342 RepID=UPI0007420C87|nr:AAA family ATPase [Myroides marinus]KUF45109.1 hypothetical protein AS361_14875 [Myroides marinus]